MRIPSFLLTVATLAVSFVCVSCGSGSNKHSYYLLSPAGPAPVNQGVGIGVGPVITASYLDRSYLVFQTSDNTLDVNEDHEWAGDLGTEFARVLGTNLGREKNTGSIQSYPWANESALDYQVSINLKRFHGTNDGNALLEASWSIYKLPSSRRISSTSATFTEPLKEDGFESLAAAQSRLIEALAKKISASIQ